MAHMISLDLPVSVFLSITLYAFILGAQAPPGNTRRNYLWGASAAAACAVLTKGLIGIVFPVMIVMAWIALTHEWRILKRIYLPSCILIFLLIAAPWHILVGQHNPEFFYFYFIKQHVLRYTTMKVGHYQPVWFFIPYLIIGFFPWIVFFPQAFLKTFPRSLQQCREHKNELFFLLWAGLIFIFFSFSKSKLIPYILPVIPPLAILTARYLQQAINSTVTVGIKSSYICLLFMSALITCACLLFPHYALTPYPHAAVISLSLAAGVLIIGMLVATFFAFSNQVKRSLIFIIGTACIFLLCIHSALSYIDTRTIASLATLIKPILTPQDEVVSYNQYYQDLPFYLERRVNILNWENELHFGMQHQDHEWMIDDTAFWQRWHSKQRIFAMMAMDEYQKIQQFHPREKHYLIGQTLTNVLISNQKLV
jgi:4-amino-4-deoxy-L-arabinose transferase-like glycosyltransferase